MEDIDWLTVILTGVSVIIGGGITWFFSKRYYVKASMELQEQTDNLRKLNALTIQMLEQANLLPDNVVVTKDEAGNPTGGLTFKLSGVAQSRSSASAIPTVSQPKDDTDASGQDFTNKPSG